MFVLDENGALAFVPEHIVIVCRLARFFHDVICLHPIFCECVYHLLASRTVAHRAEECAREAEPCTRSCGVCGVSHCRDFQRKFKRNLLTEFHTEFAILGIDIAVHFCVLETDKTVDDGVADSQYVECHENYGTTFALSGCASSVLYTGRHADIA